MKLSRLLMVSLLAAVGAAPVKRTPARPTASPATTKPATTKPATTKPATTKPATAPADAFSPESRRAIDAAKADALRALMERSAEYRSLVASLPKLQEELTAARAGSDTAAKMSASKAYNDARAKAGAMEAEAIAGDAGVRAATERATADAKARADAAAKARSDADRAEAQRRARGANWKEHLKVGMTEAEVNDLYDAIPRDGETTIRKVTDSVTAHGKTVSWLVDVMQYRTVDRAQVPTGSKTFRMCTISFEDGKVSAIDY